MSIRGKNLASGRYIFLSRDIHLGVETRHCPVWYLTQKSIRQHELHGCSLASGSRFEGPTRDILGF